MQTVTVTERVRLLLNEHFAIDYRRTEPEARLVEDLGADSLDLIELRFDTLDEFRVDIDDHEMSQVKTVKDLVDLIERKVSE